MFEMDITVRYSEINQEGTVDLHQMLDYFQDCSTFHSEKAGFGLEYLRNENKGWFVLAWDVSISRYPRFAEHLRVITEPYIVRGFFGYRRFYIQDEDGKTIVQADSQWVYMDLEKNRPVKLPKGMAEGYIPEGQVPEDRKIRVTRKLPTDGDFKEMDCLDITHFYLDTNGHVNNAYYVLWAEKLLPEGSRLTHFCIDYKKSVRLGDKIHISLDQREGECRVKISNQDGELNSTVIMEYHEE